MESPKTVWSRIYSTITSESLLEKLFLLIVSGLIVPVIVLAVSKSVEDRQKRVEAERVLLTSSVEVKRSFWEEISKTIITFETIALDVSWFGGDAKKPRAL